MQRKISLFTHVVVLEIKSQGGFIGILINDWSKTIIVLGLVCCQADSRCLKQGNAMKFPKVEITGFAKIVCITCININLGLCYRDKMRST